MTALIAQFRFYEELNDFLPVEKRKKINRYTFSQGQTVKDAIEAQGVPHTEIDLILANSVSVGFDYRLQPDDRISVYPVFESFDISPVSRVREKPLRTPRFVLDVHLGKLVRHLRLLGLDAVYRNDLTDAEIIEIAVSDKRIILTRDLGILKNKSVTHGYWVRSTDALQQAREVIARFDLARHVAPFTRCLECNGLIQEPNQSIIRSSLPARVAKSYDRFYQCADCGRLYWRGSHYKKLTERLTALGVHS
ncbi:Mut7-C ubiquitin/RNAse domain-containing protein [candidate division KSB1 bacterium]|nr:Mut7-C ubiquitin/RNAse domain-containing protein [candidate division KSB1 bacterium]